MATLTRADPIYYLVDATRAGFTGLHEASVWLSLLITALVTVCSVALATLVRRGAGA